jgi:plastocyanin
MATRRFRVSAVWILSLLVPIWFAQPWPIAAAELNVGGIDQDGGTIKGVVKFSGRQAKRKRHRVDADAYCAHAHADKPLLKEKFVFGKDETLQNVFVYVSKGLEGKKFDPPTEKLTIDQKGCQYVPHVAGVVVDQTVEILNSDDTAHNVKLLSKKNGKQNNAMPAKGMVLKKKFGKAEMKVEYRCDVHPWMSAYVHVMEHPFFAVTQDDGTFTIRGLPPGKYELSVWHEFKVFKPDKPSVMVEVAAGKAAEVTFTYAPKKKRKK